MKNTIALIISFALVAAVAAFGGRFGPGAWYAQLVKPAWTPPNWLFGPVWTALYILMAVAAWLVWKADDFRVVWVALLFYAIQLILNALWSLAFFGLHRIGWAFIDIIALWAAILVTVVLFWRVRVSAAVMMIPYIAWVTFAAVLNYALWRLNR
jgi:benzodiazapine receptor